MITPYYKDSDITIYCGDCREILPSLPSVSCAVADPPYAQTSLAWDTWQTGWVDVINADSMWVFGTLRMFLRQALDFSAWTFSQDVVWEKQNGSGFANDRFRRVHEQVALFYRGAWRNVYHATVMTSDARAKVVRRKERPPHMGVIANSTYTSVDGGPRLARSVMRVRSCHGTAVHPTQKPVGIIEPLITYSCPPGGVVLAPFMGSGTVLLAARSLGRKAIGVEVNEKYCEKAVQRLNELE